MKVRWILAVVVGGILAAQSSQVSLEAQWAPPTGSPLAAGQHPRLLLTSSSIPALRSKLGDAAWRAEFQKYVTHLESFYSSAGGSHSGAASYAFLWLTYPVPGIAYGYSQAEYGSKARAWLMNGPNASSSGLPTTSWGYPLAYDWINALLSAQDKATLVAWFKKVDTIAGSLMKDTNAFNANTVNSRAQKVLAGLAAYKDGADDAWAQASVDSYGPFFRERGGVTFSESFVSGNEGGGGQGYIYWTELGSASSVMRTEEAWRTANAIDPFTHYGTSTANIIRYHPKYLAQIEMPWSTAYSGSPDGLRHTIWKTWASTSDDAIVAKQLVYDQLTIHSGLYASIDPQMAGLSRWLLTRRVGGMGTNWYLLSGIYHFVYGRKDIKPLSPIDLEMPLTAERDDGVWLMRTGWRDNDDSFVVFTAPKWMLSNSAYTNRSPGGFEIYRKGPQVIRQGLSGHDFGSYTAGPQNILTFPDRSKTAASHLYDTQGGMRWLAPLVGASSLTEDSPSDLRGTVKRWLSDGTASRDVDYVSVDLTRAYDSTLYRDAYNPARISSYVRQFVYFRPATPGVDSDRVVVIDRATTTDTKFEKAWLFHTSTTPTVNGTATPGPARGITGTDGKTTYTGATRVTAVNNVVSRGRAMNGTTWLTPLLPASRVIVKVGGPNGSSGLSWKPAGSATPSTSDSHEYETMYGVQGYVDPPANAGWVPWVGAYRLEIIPSTLALSDTFLNVVEVGDNGTNQSPVELVKGAGMVGARVGNRIAVFNTASADLKSGSVTIPSAGAYRLLVGDLVPFGNYSVSIGGSATTRTASEGGTLYFDVSVGGQTTISVNFTGSTQAPPPPPNPPGNLRILP
jgi:hypothetical protein